MKKYIKFWYDKLYLMSCLIHDGYWDLAIAEWRRTLKAKNKAKRIIEIIDKTPDV